MVFTPVHKQWDNPEVTADVFNIMLKCYSRGSMMVCSTGEDKKLEEVGLVENHAYSLTKVGKSVYLKTTPVTYTLQKIII